MAEISIRKRLPRDAVWITAIAMMVQAALIVFVYGFGYDAHAYWLAGRELSYERAPVEQDAYLYSPAFAQVISPLAALPFPAFCAIFMIAPALAFAWLLKPLPRRWAIPFWLMCAWEILTGNVFWLLALVAVLGFRRPGFWVVAALTKISPCVGPVWFLARGEWRKLSVFTACLSIVVLASAAIDPSAWVAWVSFLHGQLGSTTGTLGAAIMPPPIVRLPLAIAVTVYAARTNRVWLVPVAMVLATPVLATASLTMLTAIPRLMQASRQLGTATGGERDAVAAAGVGARDVDE